MDREKKKRKTTAILVIVDAGREEQLASRNGVGEVVEEARSEAQPR